MAHYVVTGAAGFIGSNVVHQLIERGDTVTGIDVVNDAYDVRIKEWRLNRLRAAGLDGFERVDINDRAGLARVFDAIRSPVAGVINLAARAGVRPSVENPWLYNDSNNTGTLNLLDLCVKHGIPKFVLSSTSSLYGADNPRPYAETANTDRPMSPYAASKKAAEVMCYAYHYLHGIDATVFRYFTVYGPAGRPDMSLFRFVQWISEGRTVSVFGDGTQERDFTYVDDVARGTIAGLRNVGYEVVNLGSDEPHRLIDAVRMIEKLTGRTAQIEYSPAHKADVRASWANIDKAASVLGWRPQTNLAEGVRRMVEWYNENRTWAKDIVTGV